MALVTKFEGYNPLTDPRLIQELKAEGIPPPVLKDELTRLCRSFREGRKETNFFTGQLILIQAELNPDSIFSNHANLFVLVEKGITVILTDIDVN
jgi:hypothetical protein